ncbi:MAG TPA: Asp23/Gls24 family envelope stress response protein [Ktedonobacterales bacterium]|nr:Asp23/Gls24 family envelope stress response protein [Ktedonobacterales bacterium]
MGREREERDAGGYAIGSVRIARRVLRMVVEQAATSVRGVVGVARDVAPLPPALVRPVPWHGIGLAVHGNDVVIDLYLIAGQGENVARIGADAHEAVAGAVEGQLGMRVVAVNIYVQDVR